MLHRITGRATKCGPSAVSAIAGVPTHQAAAVVRRLFDRHAVNGVFMDETRRRPTRIRLDARLRAPPSKIPRAPSSPAGPPSGNASSPPSPFDVRATTLGTFLDAAPPGTWAVSAGNHFVAYGDGHVADSGAWFSRKPQPWLRANPDHDRIARRRIREAVRFVPVDGRFTRPEEC